MLSKARRVAALAGWVSLSVAGFADAAGANGNKVVLPTVEAAASARSAGLGVASGKASTAAAALPGSLIYRGGVSGVGVTTGAPQVYLVFWGSQWGTQSTDASGNLTFSNDKNGAAPYLQKFFRGLGSNNEQWSGVMTQSCETLSGATTCPDSAQHVGHPLNNTNPTTQGVLAGVWFDPAGAISTTGTTNDAAIANEALRAAAYFKNTTPGQNRNAQYVVVSPPGTHPGGWSATAGWCAWHDWNGDTTMVGGAVASPTAGNFAFTNLPYVTDMGTSCGQGYVNGGSGLLDGFSLVGGHEYSETITDQFPAGGWTDSSGWENADKCSWIGTSGVTGGATNLVLATGVFAVQGQWLNNTGGCSTAYARYTGTPNVITVVTPSGTQNVAKGTAVSMQLSASGTLNNSGFTYTANGLPAGLALLSSGLIQGTPTTAGSYTTWVTVADSLGAVGYGSISWVVTGTTVTVKAPANQSSIKGVTIATLQPSATSSGGATTFSWTASGLPAGIGINTSTGAITGTPTTVQAAKTVTLTAKDATGSTGSASFSWTVVNTTVTVATIANQTSARGATVSLQPTAKDSNTALTTFTWAATGLPTGLAINSTSGLISGTISATATVKTYTVTVSATDSNGAKGSKSFSWTVQ